MYSIQTLFNSTLGASWSCVEYPRQGIRYKTTMHLEFGSLVAILYNAFLLTKVYLLPCLILRLRCLVSRLRFLFLVCSFAFFIYPIGASGIDPGRIDFKPGDQPIHNTLLRGELQSLVLKNNKITHRWLVYQPPVGSQYGNFCPVPGDFPGNLKQPETRPIFAMAKMRCARRTRT